MISTGEVLALADGTVTFRQIDMWVRKGLIRPDQEPGRRERQWSRSETDIVVLMGRLIKAGISVDKSARVARAIVGNPKDKTRRTVKVGDGVWVTVDTEINPK